MTEVAAALIRDGERFLVGRRPAGKARGGLWEFVGGKVEPGETGEQALARECREELGVEAAVGAVFGRVVHDYPDTTVRLTLYETVIVGGALERREHEELRWITAAEIPLLPFCPADEPILRRLQARG